MGVFLSKYQRSLYNVAGLTAQPFWNPEQTPYIKHLRVKFFVLPFKITCKPTQFQVIETEWKAIRDEGLALRDQKTGVFQDDDEEMPMYGNLREFVLYSKGKVAISGMTFELTVKLPFRTPY